MNIVKFEFDDHCPLYVQIDNSDDFKNHSELVNEAWYYAEDLISWNKGYHTTEILEELPKDDLNARYFFHNTKDWKY